MSYTKNFPCRHNPGQHIQLVDAGYSIRIEAGGPGSRQYVYLTKRRAAALAARLSHYAKNGKLP